MFVKCIDLGLQVNLILKHLVGVLLEPIDLVGNRLLVLYQFIQCYFVLLQLQIIVFSVHVLKLVGLEHLGLSCFVLLILILKVAQLSVQFVECVLEILDLLVRFTDLQMCS